jgi:hypothetical protein
MLIIGIIGLILSGIGYFSDSRQFFHSYLTAFFFWLSIALGGLFFTMLHHIVNAKWSTVLRRLSENIMMLLPIMAIFCIPLLFGIKDLYHWSHPEAVVSDHLLQDKAPYLNTGFFIGRVVLYFVIWIIFALLLNRLSLKQDESHQPKMVTTFRRLSGGGLLLFAVTVTFAAFDWLMSLDAHWYSTIFGVYVFSGGLLGFLAILTFLVMHLNSRRVLDKVISVEHYHDLGKLLFAFTIFWGYMAFSQYFLIWYGNIPEETVWFLHRWEGSWKIITLVIVFGHFVVPFFGLFPMFVKRNRVYMRLMAIWILIMHWVDIYWLVMPTLHHHGVHLSWMDLTATVGLGGVLLYFLWNRIVSKPLVPVNDPGLEESINFVNH